MTKKKTPEYGEIYAAACRWLCDEVTDLADAAIAALDVHTREDGPLDDEDARGFVLNWIEETADGHEFVIYTGKAMLLLLASRNFEAWEETHNKQPDVTACAFLALSEDVREELDRREDEWLPSNAETETETETEGAPA